ncbi:MAG: hypothetical protein ACL93V_07930 [Candidatus Electrothrix sp. YB6]
MINIKMVVVAVALMVLMLAPLTVVHASFQCDGSVSRVGIAQTGRVSVVSTALFPDGEGRDVCNLYTPFKGVSVSTCRGWLGILMVAQVSNRSVSIQYTNDAYSCSTLPTWENALAPWAIYAN